MHDEDQDLANTDVATNGIRVWYSSFTSIDWLHDAIKDSARRARLRRHSSLRAKMRHNLDRSIGWVIVSIVGFLTAVIAFMIARTEQLLFDVKEGYCTTAWYKAKRFCCTQATTHSTVPSAFVTTPTSERPCLHWRTWAEVFVPTVDESHWVTLEADLTEYVVYIFVAVNTV